VDFAVDSGAAFDLKACRRAEVVVAVETDSERVKSILSARHTPTWFDDAKFGVFVNWGLFSIPGWAPNSGSPAEILKSHYSEAYKLSPRAHWYWNGMRIEGSPTWRYHQDVWKGCPYDDFREPFNAVLEKWDPTPWAERFHAAGAGYVIISAKSHDGYLLWPSEHRNPIRSGWQTERDVVGELADAVRKLGMRFGIYYSGGLDWTFDQEPIVGALDVFAHVPDDRRYGPYAVAHYRELIERYHPSVLWNDIGFPDVGDLYPLLYFYVTHVEEGAINDRFNVIASAFHWLRRSRLRSVANLVGRLRLNGNDAPLVPPESPIASFRTAEYSPFPKAQATKWELVRGLGNSWAWNRSETEADLIDGGELIQLLIDTVAKNGNLLLDVGPTDTGGLPEAQLSRLEAVGRWLAVNAEAIRGAHTWWSRAEGKTVDGLAIRFTSRPGVLYVILLGMPAAGSIMIADQPHLNATKVELLGHGTVEATTENGSLRISWPANVEPQPAHCIKVVLEEGDES
jgi:alpha-L-fucosidase